MPINILKLTRVKGKLLRETYESYLNFVKEALGYVGDAKLRKESTLKMAGS